MKTLKTTSHHPIGLFIETPEPAPVGFPERGGGGDMYGQTPRLQPTFGRLSDDFSCAKNLYSDLFVFILFI